jgi:hypothetical protein
MNRANEHIVSKLKPIDNIKPIPINKRCSVCKQIKLLSEFEFDISLKTKDHRAVTCNSCMQESEAEEQGHTADCIESKFLLAVATQLETLLALTENGMVIPDEILDLMCNILEQDEKNMKDLDEKGQT